MPTMTTCIFFLLLIIKFSQGNNNSPLLSNPKCDFSKDCPDNYTHCEKVDRSDQKRCIKNLSEICIGGRPDSPIRKCNRGRDCAKNSNLTSFDGWCDFDTKYCCRVDEKVEEFPMCPDRLTPLYGQEKCKGVEKEMVYSGESDQKGGICYKGYSCPPKITRPHRLSFGSRSFRTNIDCSVDVPVPTKYSFMFCHNDTGNLWVMGQLNVNGDEVTKHWTQCKINTDCGEGLVCVKEDLCRYRCYQDPTTEINYDWIIVQIAAMFLLPLIFLASIMFLTVKYLD